MAKAALKGYAMFGTGQGASRIAGVSMATSQTSDITTIERMDNIEILVSWTGTSPVGTLTVQRSPDQVTWYPLDFGSSIPISGNTGTHEIYINQLATPYIECVYTAVSGTGIITASISTKSLSGGAN